VKATHVRVWSVFFSPFFFFCFWVVFALRGFCCTRSSLVLASKIGFSVCGGRRISRSSKLGSLLSAFSKHAVSCGESEREGERERERDVHKAVSCEFLSFFFGRCVCVLLLGGLFLFLGLVWFGSGKNRWICEEEKELGFGKRLYELEDSLCG